MCHERDLNIEGRLSNIECSNFKTQAFREFSKPLSENRWRATRCVTTSTLSVSRVSLLVKRVMVSRQRGYLKGITVRCGREALGVSC